MNDDGQDEIVQSPKEDLESQKIVNHQEKKEEPLVESKYELNDNPRNSDRVGEDEGDNRQEDLERTKRLDQIKEEMNNVGKRLEEIQAEELKQTDKYSENYLKLEQEKVCLKKELIDLDYRLQVQCVNSMRQSRKRESQKKAKIVKQSKSSPAKEKKEFHHQQQQKITNQIPSKKVDQNQNKYSRKRQPKTELDWNRNGQAELQRLRRQRRMAELETELVQSQLRRSRQLALNAELTVLKNSQRYPYYSWKDYYAWREPDYSTIYPFTRRSLYPSSLYLNPYSYHNPYQYRWWI